MWMFCTDSRGVRQVTLVQLRRGRWDEEEGRNACSSGSEADGVPAVKPGNMSKRAWELQQEARELEQGAFAFDKSVVRLLCMHSTMPNQVLSKAACRDGIAMQFIAVRCSGWSPPRLTYALPHTQQKPVNNLQHATLSLVCCFSSM